MKIVLVLLALTFGTQVIAQEGPVQESWSNFMKCAGRHVADVERLEPSILSGAEIILSLLCFEEKTFYLRKAFENAVENDAHQAQLDAAVRIEKGTRNAVYLQRLRRCPEEQC
jgi:hypothetical protein